MQCIDRRPTAPDGMPRRVLQRFGSGLRWTGYLALSLLLTVAGWIAVVVTLLAGAVLCITPLAPWLVALSLTLARRVAARQRSLTRWVGEPLAPTDDLPATHTAGDWRDVMLSDGAAWRALGWIVMRLPAVVPTVFITCICWIYGFLLLAYPVAQPWLGPTTTDDTGRIHHALRIGSWFLDTWPSALATVPVGLALLALAPWLSRSLGAVDVQIQQRLLGPGHASMALRRTRASRRRLLVSNQLALRQLERDLHDGAQVHLVAARMELTGATDLLKNDDKENAQLALSRCNELLATATTSLRQISRGVRPPTLDTGLRDALTGLAAQCPVPTTTMLAEDDPDMPRPVRDTLYFCAAELLTNVVRHAGATRAALETVHTDRAWTVEVRDDGVGGVASYPQSSGIEGLRDRLDTFDGVLEVVSPPGGPTTITAQIPRE